MTEEEQKKESVEEVKTAPAPVDEKELIKRIQVILFASGRAVDVEELSSMTKEPSTRNIKKAVAELKKQMEERDSPLMIVEEKEDTWKFSIKDDYLTFVTDLIPSMELDKATLETLAVIAWRNPVLQADVVKIRTSNAYDHIAKLVDMGFVSKERYGRSFVLKPTTKFFEYFDLPSKEYIKEMFKNVTDGIRFIDDKKEEQKEVEEFEQPEKVGDMPVYETTPDKPEEETEEEPEIHLGKLEVYGEGGEKQEKTKEKIEFDELEKQEEEEPEEEPETVDDRSDEDKAMDVINNLAEMDEQPTTPEETEEGEETEEEQPKVEEEPEAPPERELSPELEEFAGTKKPEPKHVEEYEEKKEEPTTTEKTEEGGESVEETKKPEERDIDALVEEK